jgi:transketolase
MIEKKQEKIKKIKKFSLQLKKNVLEMAYCAGVSSSHFGGALSILDIIATLFSSFIKYDSKNPEWEERDRFILSKGHACLAYYSVLTEINFIEKELLKTFEKDNSDLLGHPVINRKLGIEFSNGSLGMGLSLGIGLAIAAKKRNKNYNTYVIMGDGECNEGSVWEASMAAANFNLDNLIVIIDNNNFQQTGKNHEIMNLQSLKEKWTSFGWQTDEVDGHNIESLFNYFNQITKNKKPKALIAKTIKGKGFSFSEENNDWHHAILTKKFYDHAINEIKKDNEHN